MLPDIVTDADKTKQLKLRNGDRNLLQDSQMLNFPKAAER